MSDSRTSLSFTKQRPADPIGSMRKSPHASLDAGEGPLNRCRKKRLLKTLNRYTSEQVSSNEKQSCQNGDFDLHEIHCHFPFLSAERHRKPYAKRIDARQRTTSAIIGKFQSPEVCRGDCDEEAVPMYRHAPKCCLTEEEARPEIYWWSQFTSRICSMRNYREKYLSGYRLSREGRFVSHGSAQCHVACPAALPPTKVHGI